ncbi:hypothetical protein AB0G82_34260 [Streptomyces anulatus]|nr:hypothetical protein [Streptomyces sp. C3-3]
MPGELEADLRTVRRPYADRGRFPGQDRGDEREVRVTVQRQPAGGSC